jgi:galactokinase
VKTFADVFGAEPQASGDAPGRVNLLGEHTDYNDGFVLPTAIPQRTHVQVRRTSTNLFRVYSANLRESAEFTVDSAPHLPFARYVYGCIRTALDEGMAVPPLDIYVRSTVPIGVGLSSSAALEVATLRALRALLDASLDDVRLAQLAQRAEIEYAGVNCGILDQMACSLLEEGTMLFLDTRSLDRERLPLPARSEILVIDSGTSRSLATSGYNERRAECEKAAAALGVASLRDVVNVNTLDHLPEPLKRRARHVITENDRVQRAVSAASPEEFGKLMSESHESLRDDYAVSIPALDDLAARLQADRDVFGAKLTGAGFGGACVALCRAGTARDAAGRVISAYNTGARQAAVLVPER